jgi:hypothetical protein
LSTERAFTYADLYATLRNRYSVAWLTLHAAAARESEEGLVYCWWKVNGSCRLCVTADGKSIVAFARSPEHLLEIYDIHLRLLAVSEVHRVTLNSWNSPAGLINTPNLAYLMEQCQSLKFLSLQSLEMDEDHCRVLGAYSRPGLEIVLGRCKISSAGASALAEVLGRNQGPNKLDFGEIDNSVLADGLRGNSRLKVFRAFISGSGEVREREFLAIAGAVKENKGLVVLDFFYGFCMNNEMWGPICDSVETHPTLQVLDVRGQMNAAPGRLKSWIQAILYMMTINLSIHTVHWRDSYSEHELFRGSVVPYLETNRFRPRLLAIQRTRPIPYRAKVLGRALLSARTEANSFWMLLSGNAEVAFPPTATTIVAAANLPTPATTADTYTIDVATFAGPVTTAATAGLPTAAAARLPLQALPLLLLFLLHIPFPLPILLLLLRMFFATPSSSQKRKAQISMLPDPEA